MFKHCLQLSSSMRTYPRERREGSRVVVVCKIEEDLRGEAIVYDKNFSRAGEERLSRVCDCCACLFVHT